VIVQCFVANLAAGEATPSSVANVVTNNRRFSRLPGGRRKQVNREKQFALRKAGLVWGSFRRDISCNRVRVAVPNRL
jgi:hypothetical protein